MAPPPSVHLPVEQNVKELPLFRYARDLFSFYDIYKNSMAIFPLIFFATTKTRAEPPKLQIFLRVTCSQLLYELYLVFNQLYYCHGSNVLKESLLEKSIIT